VGSIDLRRSKLLFTGYTAGKAQSTEFQCKVIFLIACISAPTAAVFSVINYFESHLWLTAIEILAIILLVPCFRVLKRPESLRRVKNILLINAAMVFSALFVDGGVAGTGMLWALIFPFLAFLLMGLPVAWYWVGGFLFMITMSALLDQSGIYRLPYDHSVLIYYPAVFLFFSLIAAAFELQLERLHVRHQKRLEELHELQSNLKHNIRQRTAALQKSNENLKREIEEHQTTSHALRESEARFYQAQKMEAVGTLVGGIAHDFNNMLSGISANLFMLKRKTEQNPEIDSRVENINQLVGSAADMIRQLLTFARQESVEYKTFDLLPFISESFKLASVSISPKVSLSYDFQKESMWVKANGTQLQQVLMNLINNARDAVKHCKTRQIKVTLQRLENPLDLKRKFPEVKGDAFAKLSVSDTGNGIEVEKLNKIFEPFFTTKKAGEGTGLGLAMCYGAIESHGGTIEVESNIGKGTTFHIYLPILNDAEEELLHNTLQDAVRGNGECILLADDDPILAKIQRESLTALGYKVIQTTNGQEAVEVMQQRGDEIDLAILDVVMPVLGGVAAARKIRKIKDIPTIFVTGYGQEETLNGTNLPTPDDFILDKPFTIDELSHAVRKQLLAATHH